MKKELLLIPPSPLQLYLSFYFQVIIHNEVWRQQACDLALACIFPLWASCPSIYHSLTGSIAFSPSLMFCLTLLIYRSALELIFTFPIHISHSVSSFSFQFYLSMLRFTSSYFLVAAFIPFLVLILPHDKVSQSWPKFINSLSKISEVLLFLSLFLTSFFFKFFYSSFL